MHVYVSSLRASRGLNPAFLVAGAIAIGLLATVLPVRPVVLAVAGLILLAVVAHPELGFLVFPLSAVCLPALPQFLPPRGLFPEELVLASLVVSLALRSGKQSRLGAPLGVVNQLLLTLVGSQLVTLLIGAFRWGVTYRDAFEVFRTLKYFVVFNVGRTSDDKAARWAAHGIIASLVCAAAVGLLEYFNPRGIGDWIITAYGKQSALRFLDTIQRASGYWRVPGTLGNPNAFGYVLDVILIGVFASRNCLVFRQGRGRGLVASVLYLTGLVIILLTRSRTATLGAIAVLAVLGGIRVLTMKRRNVLVWLAVTILCLTMACFVGSVLPRSRLRDMESASASLIYRAQVWDHVVSATMRESPLFGLGPEKLTEVERFEEIDSELMSFLKRWGMVGVLIYLALLAAIGHFGYGLMLHSHKRSERCRGASILALGVVAVIVSIPGGFWANNQLSDLFFFLLGILAGSNASDARAVAQDAGTASERMMEGA